MRTKEKVFVDELHYRRVFDQAKPPLDRLFETGALSPENRMKLEQWRSQINPLQLRKHIDELVEILVALPIHNNKEVIDINQTLRKEKLTSVALSFEPITSFQ